MIYTTLYFAFYILLGFHGETTLTFAVEIIETPIEYCSKQQCEENGGNSYLWTLKSHPFIYIFGSIHRPYTTVWDAIPRNVKKAFKASENVYFEIDLTNVKYLLTIARCQLLPKQQTLFDVLPSEILQKLQNHLRHVRQKVPIWLEQAGQGYRDPQKVFEYMTNNWKRKRPIWLLLQLAALNSVDVQTSHIPSLDFHLFLKAGEAGKIIDSLESPGEHCSLNGINSNQAIIYLNNTLTKYELAQQGKITLGKSNELTYHYLCGDLEKFIFSTSNDSTTGLTSDMKNFEESLAQELLFKRNKNMAEKIIKEIARRKKRKRMFFTIGAGHLIGKRGIINILEKRGFKTKHIKNKDCMNRFRKTKTRTGNITDDGIKMQQYILDKNTAEHSSNFSSDTTVHIKQASHGSSVVKFAPDWTKHVILWLIIELLRVHVHTVSYSL